MTDLTPEGTDVDPAEDPTNGELPATEFPADDVPDPEQTPEDLGADEDGQDEPLEQEEN